MVTLGPVVWILVATIASWACVGALLTVACRLRDQTRLLDLQREACEMRLRYQMHIDDLRNQGDGGEPVMTVGSIEPEQPARRAA